MLTPTFPKLKEDTQNGSFKKSPILLGLNEERNSYVFPHCEMWLWHTQHGYCLPTDSPKLAHQSILCSYWVGNTLLLAGPPGSQSQANLAQLGEPLLRGAENLTPSVLSFVKQQEGNRRQQKKSYLTLQGYIEKRPKNKK